MSERMFICDVEPLGDGRWEIWISEEPYRGVDTDSALGEWDRQRVGGAYTSRRLVGRRVTRLLADRTAKAAVRRAKDRAAEDEKAGAAWRANCERQRFRVTSDTEPEVDQR